MKSVMITLWRYGLRLRVRLIHAWWQHQRAKAPTVRLHRLNKWTIAKAEEEGRREAASRVLRVSHRKYRKEGG